VTIEAIALMKRRLSELLPSPNRIPVIACKLELTTLDVPHSLTQF